MEVRVVATAQLFSPRGCASGAKGEVEGREMKCENERKEKAKWKVKGNRRPFCGLRPSSPGNARERDGISVIIGGTSLIMMEPPGNYS